MVSRERKVGRGGRWLGGLVGLAVLIALLPAAEAGQFALLVSDVSEVNEPWPLVGGLPFPQGAIRDAAAVRITSGGREVPAQVDVAATWREGSVRWALAGFTGRPDAEYQVEYGPGVSRSAPAAALRLHREADESVILGPLEGAIAQLRISDAVRYREAFTPPEQITAADGHTRVLFLLNGNCTGATGTGETLNLEVLPR
jgi:hypothetical protein